MKVNVTFKEDRIFNFSFYLEAEDTIEGAGQGSMKVGYLANSFNFYMPINLDKIPHPDIIGLVALVSVRPWIKSQLILERGVSQDFHDMAKKLFNIAILPIDERLVPRQRGTTPILSYSGGVDSVAASEVFPKSIPYVYYERINHKDLPDKAPHVQVKAITNIIEQTAKLGRNVFIVSSDLEHICKPYPTLPHWFGIAAGILLIADQLDGGMIIMGGTLETFFMDMGKSWKGAGGKGLDPLSRIVGLPICRPMLGVTEIGTMKIAQKSELGSLARSCVLGTFDEPCGQCSKCVRKIMTESVVSNNFSVLGKLKNLDSSSPGVKAILNAEPPYYMQAQLEYCLSRIQDKSDALQVIYDRIKNPGIEKTLWMDKYYTPAIEYSVPIDWRGYLLYELSNKLEFMSIADEELALNFN